MRLLDRLQRLQVNKHYVFKIAAYSKTDITVKVNYTSRTHGKFFLTLLLYTSLTERSKLPLMDNKLNHMCWTICFSLFLMVHADFFTSVTELENLLRPHKIVIEDLRAYIDMQEKRFSILRSYLRLYVNEYNKAMQDVSDFLSAPLNAFILIKRLVCDLDNLVVIMRKGEEYTPLVIKNLEEENLIGAAQAIARLQTFYNLDVKDLANGNLNHVAYSIPMTASDCYELARVLLTEKIEIKAALAWMTEANRKYSEENTSYPFTKLDIMNYISSANNLLAKQPNNDTVQEFQVEEEPANEVKLQKTYEELCRGDLVIPTNISKRLTCRYMTENHPFFKLAPYKIEIRYLNPDVVLFYDVLSDHDIKIIKKLASPVLERAVINDPKTGFRKTASQRISKVGFIFDADSERIALLGRRISYMTGLNTDRSKELQVVNYGIGGHYQPHYDFATKSERLKYPVGKRQTFATILFYMTDVAQGGATVFTELGVRVHPVKGSALFWLNLHPSGEGNHAMRHAACPLLQGNKWVVSKFILINGQQFLRPCNLEYQEEGFINKIPNPVPKSSS